eukprot:TRINITY_DN9753_c0_g1_i1.p1 TRINITY_DN9753_c0_g1~~TRINITY_DN9753_c0_g1_i1.p1  ORF type:complete len:226 (-),score=29.51 TRINITY_DN9753_c0_g1_i1:6-683(-)
MVCRFLALAASLALIDAHEGHSPPGGACKSGDACLTDAAADESSGLYKCSGCADKSLTHYVIVNQFDGSGKSRMCAYCNDPNGVKECPRKREECVPSSTCNFCSSSQLTRTWNGAQYETAGDFTVVYQENASCAYCMNLHNCSAVGTDCMGSDGKADPSKCTGGSFCKEEQKSTYCSQGGKAVCDTATSETLYVCASASAQCEQIETNSAVRYSGALMLVLWILL